MLEIDGSFGEGGGQILRTSVALAAIMSKEIRVFNVRAGRAEPGIKPQHLTSIKAAAELCSGEFKDLRIGSTEFSFKPGKLRSGSFRFDVGTAGSVNLVLQTLMPMLAFSREKINLEILGGTDVKWSPPVDYVRKVVLPILRKIGLVFEFEVVRRGYYPKGGGLVRFSTQGNSDLRPVSGNQPGPISSITGISHVVGLPKHVAERQAAAAARRLQEEELPDPSIRLEIKDAPPNLTRGSGLLLLAESQHGCLLGSDALGERGLRAEDVGITAGRILAEEIRSGAFLDRHMGDIIVPYMVLANGASEVSISRVTQHTQTNVKVAEWLTGSRFHLEGETECPGILRITGIGGSHSN